MKRFSASFLCACHDRFLLSLATPIDQDGRAWLAPVGTGIVSPRHRCREVTTRARLSTSGHAVALRYHVLLLGDINTLLTKGANRGEPVSVECRCCRMAGVPGCRGAGCGVAIGCLGRRCAEVATVRGRVCGGLRAPSISVSPIPGFPGIGGPRNRGTTIRLAPGATFSAQTICTFDSGYGETMGFFGRMKDVKAVADAAPA